MNLFMKMFTILLFLTVIGSVERIFISSSANDADAKGAMPNSASDESGQKNKAKS